MSKFDKEVRDKLLELYQEYGSRDWDSIEKEFNKEMPGKLDEETGQEIPWTKKQLQRKRNNFITHGHWPKVASSSNPTLQASKNSLESESLIEPKPGPSSNAAVIQEENLPADHVILQRYVSISIFSYFSV